MQQFLLVLQICFSLLLIVLITVQAKGRGLGRAWGTGSISYTRRGLEKLIFRSTFVITFLFLLISAISFFL